MDEILITACGCACPGKRMIRAQASLEYAVIVGLVMLATIPLFYLAQERYTGDVVMADVESVVDRIVDAADEAYMAGPGTVKFVWITMPGGMVATDVGGRHVSVTFNVNGRATEVHRLTKANVRGSLPAESGGYRIKVEAQDDAVTITP